MSRAVAQASAIIAGAAAVALGPVAGSSAAVMRADPSPIVVSHIGDKRIKESSDLAYSAKYPNLAYTMNDSHNKMVVYAIQVSTGRTVGTVDLSDFNLSDPESLAVDPQGRLWVGDLGDNDGNRDDASIVVFNEPGPRSGPPQAAQQFPVSYPDGGTNVEAMMVYPTTRQVFVINKTDGGDGTLFALPPTLRAGEKNEATNLHRRMPARVSDATFTPDGRHALVKTATGVVGYDVQTWKVVASFPTPGLDKGESITVEPGGKSILVGSEGDDSPILRFALPAPLVSAVTATSQRTPAPTATTNQSAALPPLTPVEPNAEPAGLTWPAWTPLAGLSFILAAAAAWVTRMSRRRRRLAHRHRRIDERQGR